jgi:phosphoribosyl-AMP cyclohydrolase
MSVDVNPNQAWLDAVRFDDQGLVVTIAQDQQTGRILMVAWSNRQALQETVSTGFATYFSRSRQRLWRKGEESGHRQRVREIRLDCDGDVLVLSISQEGGVACHTGRESCFYYCLQPDGQGDFRWVAVDPVLKDPAEIYKK